MWYTDKGKDYDVVISTRVRFARNVLDCKFPNIMTNQEKNNVINKLSQCIKGSEYTLLKMKDIDEVTQNSLKEKHLISKEFVGNKYGAIITNKDNSIVTMVNEEDHLRIQSFGAGFCVNDCYKKLKEFTEKLSENIEFAKSDKYGYLTSCPTNVGSGMRVSVMLHLPALSKLGLLNKLFSQATDIGMSVRGMYGENTVGSGNLFQISNRRTLGMTDENLISNIEAVITTIIEQERKARTIIKESSYSTKDEVYRAYGILKYSRDISDKEAMELLSKVRLGVAIGIIDEVNLEKVTSLMLDIQKNSLEIILKEKIDETEVNIKRASYIREEMK